MMNELEFTYRPWGEAESILSSLSSQSWSYLGCISPCKRSHYFAHRARQLMSITNETLVVIHDEPYVLWQDIESNNLKREMKGFVSSGGKGSDIVEYSIIEPIDTKVKIINTVLSRGCRRILFDISAFPKSYYFPLIKLLLNSDEVDDLVVLYTQPKAYGSQFPLAANHSDGDALPLFREAAEERPTIMIVGVGYQVLGLSKMLLEFAPLEKSVNVLFPFPGKSSGISRNWDSVRRLTNEIGQDRIGRIVRVNPKDVSEMFDCIRGLVYSQSAMHIMAPFGPKTMSLAMCLYCCEHPDISAAYYTQPRSYSPEYSIGVSGCTAYVIRKDRINYYRE